nr:MAG TPA: hypothetical protein [Caudoviricetes sp.]
MQKIKRICISDRKQLKNCINTTDAILLMIVIIVSYSLSIDL